MDERRIKESEAFVLKDGTRIASLKELYGILSTMSDADYTHHVNGQKNDFASWVEHTHQDRHLAQQLRQAKSRDEMQKAIFIAMFR